ncbi:MAG: RagB/SusD family nutrient uptake outer membrane protein [Candidatus Azobacteroides sp.]|nr:RagB/SusD family nutrient uptake outer membrane protein [Candidatus Azobacteroides sp.]
MNTQKIKSINILLAALVLFGLVSCNDFLGIPPKSLASPENYFRTDQQLQSYVIPFYSDFLPGNSDWTYGIYQTDGNSDNMAGSSCDDSFVTGQLKVPAEKGDWYFDAIYRVNYFIETVLPLWEAGQITGDEAHIKQAIGEAYFFRAYLYSERVMKVGDFPIITHILPDKIDVLTDASKRMPRNEVVRFILSDLDEAISFLSPKSIDGQNNRISVPVAQLLKSRVALYEGTWLKYFKGTPFVPNGPGWPGATKDYNANYQYPSGSIDNESNYFLEIAIEAADVVASAIPLTDNTGIVPQSVGEQNPYLEMYGAVDMSAYPEIMLWRQYSISLGLTNNVAVYAAAGGNLTGLTRGMVDNFLMSNGLPIYAPGSGYAGDDSISYIRINRDGRAVLFIKEPYQVNKYLNQNLGDHGNSIEPHPDIITLSGEVGYNTGYACRKGWNPDGLQYVSGKGSVGCIEFRAAEAYLNYMEAYYERYGNIGGKVDQYWKAIRTRAKVDPDYNKTISNTDMAQEALNDWGAYSQGAVLTDKVLYNIRRERRCELMAEGLRRNDLKRWRSLDQLVNNPYQIEGFKLWGPMQYWYAGSRPGSTLLKYSEDGSLTVANVSAPSKSPYLRPYQILNTNLAYNGLTWRLAHYLSPINYLDMQLTASDPKDVSTSPIYQNPYWESVPNTVAIE